MNVFNTHNKTWEPFSINYLKYLHKPIIVCFWMKNCKKRRSTLWISFTLCFWKDIWMINRWHTALLDMIGSIRSLENLSSNIWLSISSIILLVHFINSVNTCGRMTHLIIFKQLYIIMLKIKKDVKSFKIYNNMQTEEDKLSRDLSTLI